MDESSRVRDDTDDAQHGSKCGCASVPPQRHDGLAETGEVDGEQHHCDGREGRSSIDNRESQDVPSVSKRLGKSKQDVAATLLKMDHFADRLASIRSDIVARSVSIHPVQPQHAHLPRSPTRNAPAKVESPPRVEDSCERLKFPLLQLLAVNKERAARPSDPFLSIEAIQRRSDLQQQYTTAAERLAGAEQAAADAVQNADRLAEESRIAMTIYSQNERMWSFDERATRYQKVMGAKEQADIARINAEDQKKAVQLLRAELVNPYGALLSLHSPRIQAKRNIHLAPRPATPEPARASLSEEYVRVWLLAAQSTNLGFTPRAMSNTTILGAEKELSTHVVYYAAASALSEADECSTRLREGDRANVSAEDGPPRSGWISCSLHGVAPAPQVTRVKSSIETWVVSGAGVGHLNGKYISNGMHDNVRKFKSSSGVELFRKRVPISSSLAQGLQDAPNERKREIFSPATSESTQPSQPEDSGGHEETGTGSAAPLPTALKAIEHDEANFASMSKIGSWLGANEVREKHRRRRENQDRGGESISRVLEDGGNVMVQDAKGRLDTTSDVQISRREASAALCREWVLFMGCSRRQGQPRDGTSDPPKQKVGLGCLKRHYYISVEEKETMAIWAQDVEARLEHNVLLSIIKREERIARVHHLCSKCMSKFQQNLSRDTDKVARQILVELNSIRFLSVRVLESIDKWRAHARKLGFARYETSSDHHDDGTIGRKNDEVSVEDAKGNQGDGADPPLLGWSASITVSTGRQLYKGSNAFVSKVKRFCRAEDASGKREQQIVYLGYYATRMEAERAYEEYATAEARRLNTTVAHLPRHRSVFRSCGKHFAVESERLGPSVCIECKVKQLATLSSGADEWTPPFFYTPGENYILKMGSDLDFLDDVPPITSLLNDGHGTDDPVFPILGNVFLLPKTPIQDPSLAIFTTCGLAQAPRLGVALSKERDSHEINEETLDRDRILSAQQIFLQELQIYQPELFPEGTPTPSRDRKSQPERPASKGKASPEDAFVSEYRVVEALYWDRCAALRIQQRRKPLAFRQPNIWCRPDAGEWSSLVVRGKHQQHFLFETRLALAGKETQEKRRQILKALRRLLKTPLYWIHSRDVFTGLIADGCSIKGDVVMLEVRSASKYLEKYDIWCCKTLVVQRWYRGVSGRRRAKARKKALVLVCNLRKRFAEQIVETAKSFYETQVVPSAIRRAVKKISKPEFTAALKLDGEFVVVSFHSLNFFQRATIHPSETTSRGLERSVCCTRCARRFHVRTEFRSSRSRFEVSNGVCCCSLNGGNEREQSTISESWFVRAYNPVNNVVHRMKMENSLVQQLTSSLYPPKLGRLSSSTPAECARFVASGTCSRNPVARKWETHDDAVVASAQTNFYRTQGDKAHQDLLNWRLLSSEATQKRKLAIITRDRTMKTLDGLKASYAVSVDMAKRALDFTSRRFHEAQAWDPLENANDWKLLVQKRQLQRDIELAERELGRCRLEVFQTTYNEQYLRARAGQVQEQYEHGWLPTIQHENQKMEDASVLESAAKTVVERSMRQICDHFLTLRDGYFAPTRRHLVLQSRTWKERSGVRIAVPGLQRGRNAMRRRVLMLRDFGKTQQLHERMIVEVSVSRSPSVSAGDVGGSRYDVWVSAYNPITSFVQEVFLEWELVELLVGLKSKKHIYSLDTGHRRSSLLAITDQLLSMAMLDRFTGEFTLRKLQFYHHMRLLRPLFLSSKWFLDVKKGRKCGPGDEILRQAACVDGRLVVVVVYENWGDLTFAIYHAASGETYRLLLLLRDIFDLLGSKPLMLRLWVCSVKANNYTPSLLMYLLKHARFRASDATANEMVVFEPKLPSSSKVKRFQKGMRIQSRQMLVSIKEDASGDFAVDAFDWRQNHTYTLLLEREQIRRLVRQTGTASSGVASSRYLLLQKNRSELFEWIASRLTFQSLLHHPQVLASAHSPLVFGTHIRQSFRMFNEWIASSVRNPVQSVQAEEVNRWVADVDAAAFSHLQFDQLALLTEKTVPYGYDKESIGTLDWFASSAIPFGENRSKTALADSPYVKMDFFWRSHNLFVRLRKEIQSETETRLERTSCAALETQEKLSVMVEIRSALESSASMLVRWQTQSMRAKAIIDERAIRWRQIHLELAGRVPSSDLGRTVPKDAEKVSNALLFSGDEDSLGVDLPELFGSVGVAEMDFVAKVIEISSGALDVASRYLAKCCEHIEVKIKPALSRFEASASIGVQEPCSVEKLKEVWRAALQFRRSAIIEDVDFNGVEDASRADDLLLWSRTPGVAEIRPHSANSESDSCDQQAPLETGVLIPTCCDEPIQEIFLGDSIPCSRLGDFVDSVSAALKPLMIQHDRLQRKPNDINLVAKRVHDGILVYQKSSSEFDFGARGKLDRNARACGLAMDSSILGLALYYPIQRDRSFLDRLGRTAAVYHDLATRSDPSQSDGCMARRKQVGNRVKQQLPWKVFAGERLQAARSLKRMRATERFSITKYDTTMEDVCIATLPVTFRQLETLFGDFRPDRLRGLLEGEFPALFAVDKRSVLEKASGAWSLCVKKPLVMRNVLVSVDNAGEAIAIPTSEGRGGLRSEHLQVEIDSLEQPRRLLFSCRELQTQQRYSLDCSYHQLQRMMQSIDTTSSSIASSKQGTSSNSKFLSIADWRGFAQMAASFLVFRKKNGATCLDFCASRSANPEETETGTAKVKVSAADEPVAAQHVGLHQKEEEVQMAIMNSQRHRFQKHQLALRHAMCQGFLSKQHAHSTSRRLGYEWMRMTQEDFSAQNCRGLLVLESKVLKKLKTAYAVGTKRASSSNAATAEERSHSMKVQLLEIAKEMGLHDEVKGGGIDDVEKSVLAIRESARRNRRKPASAPEVEQKQAVLQTTTRADFSEIAEWWRRHMVAADLEHKAHNTK